MLPTSPVTPLLLLVAMAIGCGLCDRAAAEQPSAFAKAIENAQQRTVKIYGAGIARVAGYASGVIVSGDGHVLTAQGVYLASQRLRVGLADGSVHPAKVIRRSLSLQVALLKIEQPTPNYFDLTDQPTIRRGDWVLAVSNAFKVADGPEPLSVSLGVVSLRTRVEAKRGVQDIDYQGDALMIDAITSNPGAPGGALVTTDGRLAGMIGRIIESRRTNTRINYAVPVDQLQQFMAGESPETPAEMNEKATLGIRLFTLSGLRGPAYVDRVSPGSPAAAATLQADDLIVSIDGQVVRDVRDYQQKVDRLQVGKKVKLVIKRRGKVIEVAITPVAKR